MFRATHKVLDEPLSLQVVAAGANPIQITRGIEKTVKALVEELKKISKDVSLFESQRS